MSEIRELKTDEVLIRDRYIYRFVTAYNEEGTLKDAQEAARDISEYMRDPRRNEPDAVIAIDLNPNGKHTNIWFVCPADFTSDYVEVTRSYIRGYLLRVRKEKARNGNAS